MQITRIIVILLIAVSFILSACATPASLPTVSQSPASSAPTQQTQTSIPPTQTPSQVSPPKASSVANISMFSSAKEGDLNKFYFLLEDVAGRNVNADGNVKLEIFDDVNSTLYQNQFDVKASQYVDYQFRLTGQNMGKAYEWRVPTTDIKKGVSAISWGRAVLTFTTLDGRKLTAEDKTIQIPVYTDAEIKQMAEAEYAKIMVSIGQKITKGKFEVTIVGAGFLNTYDWGKKKEYFRVDIEVKNVGSAADYFSPSGMAILDNQGNQYEKSYGGSLDTFSQIYPNVTKKGYVLFESVPKTIGSAKLTFQLGYDAQYKPYLFEYSIPLK